MYRQIAVTTLIAAPLIASAAAHFVPRGNGIHRSERAQADAPQEPARHATAATLPMPAQDTAAPLPSNGAESASLANPALDPVASVDPDAIAAAQSRPVTPVPPPMATEPQGESAPGPMQRHAERY